VASATLDGDVKMERRIGKDRRNSEDRRKQDIPVASDRRKSDRRKTPRRRQIDPTTCERDYSGDEIEFMQALDAYKRASGRMFPTCSEILEVIRDLGYRKVEAPDAIPAEDEVAVATPSGEAETAEQTDDLAVDVASADLTG